MARTTVFLNNKTQAVRLPRDVALPDNVRSVEITAVGAARIITPVNATWDHWFEHGTRVTDDFLTERAQPAAQERDAL